MSAIAFNPKDNDPKYAVTLDMPESNINELVSGNLFYTAGISR